MTLNYTLRLPHMPQTLKIVYFFHTDAFSDLIHQLMIILNLSSSKAPARMSQQPMSFCPGVKLRSKQ